MGTLLMILASAGCLARAVIYKSLLYAVAAIVCFGYAVYESLPWLAALICLLVTFIFLWAFCPSNDKTN